MIFTEKFQLKGIEFPLFPYRTDQWGKDLRTRKEKEMNKIHYTAYNMWRYHDLEKDPYRIEEAGKLSETWVAFTSPELADSWNQQVARGIFNQLTRERKKLLMWIDCMCDKELKDYKAKRKSFKQADDSLDQYRLVLPWLDKWPIEEIRNKYWPLK